MGGVEVIVRPGAGEWAGMVRGGGIDVRARRFREQLGLAGAEPVFFAGHQAQVWHPGILAKAMAIDGAARRSGGTARWIVVDQDDHDPWEVRYPVCGADGRLTVRTWRIDGSARAEGEHVPTGNRGAARAAEVPTLGTGETFAALGVDAGLAAIARAVGARAEGAGSAARQIALATMDLMRELGVGGERGMGIITTREIAGTELFAEVVERMRAEPRRVVETYNTAVRRHARARIAELGEEELPLWHAERRIGSARKRVTAGMLATVAVGELSPRALLMTGMLRWAGCDLFVHGTGGAGPDGASGYDAITTEWMREWLGVEIAPTAMVTATVRLGIPSEEGLITPEQIARARWMAHAARHRPAMLKDAEGERVREGAVATLVRLKYKKDVESRRVKLEAYRSLHGALEGVRARHAAELGRLADAAASAAARRAEAEIVADRTWAFPLYEPGQMEALRAEIEGRFGG